jgi:Flp pilus assembly pilin Flp
MTMRPLTFCRRSAKTLVGFLQREDGTTTVEYAVLLSLIVVTCMASMLALGPAAGDTFRSTSTTVGTYGVP